LLCPLFTCGGKRGSGKGTKREKNKESIVFTLFPPQVKKG
jgi:hypothetical protein